MRVGVSLIGTPDGFESLNVGLTEHLNMGRKVDLDNSVINILPDTDILVVRRESDGNRFRTYITYYRFAKEIRTSRTGSFYGSAFVFEDFIPDDFDLLCDSLENLANLTKTLCIDPSDNRFFRHLSELDASYITSQDPCLLSVDRYSSGNGSLDTRLSSKRCFLRLDKTVPDYAQFLARVISNDSSRTSDLPYYQIVYTSTYDEVVKEVKQRRGLEVETFDSLANRYKSDRRNEVAKHEAPSTSSQKLVESSGKEQSKELATVSDVLDSPVADLPQTESHADVNSDGSSRIDRKGFGATSTLFGTHGEDMNSAAAIEEASDGLLVTRARNLERRFKSRRFRMFVYCVIVIFVALVVALAYVLLPRVVEWMQGDSNSSSELTIYYRGCPKESELTTSTAGCTPEYIASQFMGQLRECPNFITHLRGLDSDERDAFQKGIEDQIKASLANYDLLKAQSGRLEENVRPLHVGLYFPGANRCVDTILANTSDFSRQPPRTRESEPSPTTVQASSNNRNSKSPTPNQTKNVAKGQEQKKNPPGQEKNVTTKADKNPDKKGGETRPPSKPGDIIGGQGGDKLKLGNATTAPTPKQSPTPDRSQNSTKKPMPTPEE